MYVHKSKKKKINVRIYVRYNLNNSIIGNGIIQNSNKTFVSRKHL